MCNAEQREQFRFVNFVRGVSEILSGNSTQRVVHVVLVNHDKHEDTNCRLGQVGAIELRGSTSGQRIARQRGYEENYYAASFPLAIAHIYTVSILDTWVLDSQYSCMLRHCGVSTSVYQVIVQLLLWKYFVSDDVCGESVP